MVQSPQSSSPPPNDYGLLALTGFLLPVLLAGLPFILGMLMLNGQAGLAVATLVLGGMVIFGAWIAAVID